MTQNYTPNEITSGLSVSGHILIRYADTGEVIRDLRA